jgi:hypothetical protein
MYWLFNNRIFNLTGKEKEILSWEQRRNFKGRQGDQIVIYKFDFKSQLFIYLYRIIDIEIDPLHKGESISTDLRITVTTELLKDFKEEKEIEDYIYSFPRIIYFRKFLYRHFNRKYYRLTGEEFNAIVNDDIFEARSIIGTALNSMHFDHRKAFSQILIENYPEILQNRYRHSQILHLFNQYFNYAVITPSRQLVDAFDNIKEFTSAEILSSLAFTDGETRRNIENISMQVAMINETLEQFQIAIYREGQEITQDRKFERLFRNKPLPIDIIE